MDINEHLKIVATQLLNQAIDSTKQQVDSQISKELSRIDFRESIHAIVKSHLTTILETLEFPPSSIPHKTIDFTGMKFTGDMIKAGIIEQFGSTGIEDRATHVQLTLMDHASVFESSIWAPDIQAKGNASVDGNLTVKGNLIVAGELPTDSAAFKSIVKHTAIAAQESLLETMNDDWFAGYSRVMFDVINKDGLDLDRITQGGKEVVKGNQLGYHITDSNLQRVGYLNDLQTRGETLLSDTLYVTSKRAGVNTLDPSAAFVVWDEECEIVVAKRKQDVGYIGTTRKQPVILGSNSKENIVLDTEGGVAVQSLTLGKVSMSSTSKKPSYDAPRGAVVFNESPDIGLPIGWVSLGGARWAGFGKISDN